MKKQILILVLGIMMSLSLVACGEKEADSGNTETNISTETSNNSTEKEAVQSEVNQNNEQGKPAEGQDYNVGENGRIAITKEYCAKNMSLVAITTDNWKEYFQVVEETLKEVDSFGEVKETTRTVAKPCLEGKYVYGFYNPIFLEEGDALEQKGAFEFKNLKTGQTVSNLSLYDEVAGEVVYTLDDFELTRVSATLMLLSIPDEFWNTDEYGIEFVHIGKPRDPFPFTYQNGEEVDSFIVTDIVKRRK